MKNQIFAGISILLTVFLISEESDSKQSVSYNSRNVEEIVKQTQKLVNMTLDKYEKDLIKNNPDPSPTPDNLVCRCNGSKVVTHGDGHQTPCQCSSKPGGCICKPLNPPLPKDSK